MPRSRRRPDGPTPLGQIARQSGLALITDTSLNRTVADVAFDDFVFGSEVLCNDGTEGVRAALERGRRSDGLVLAVGAVKLVGMPEVWIAAQSNRGADHLGLGGTVDTSVGHAAFDARFDLDVDGDSLLVVRSILDDELCDRCVDLDDTHGPLIVIFDGGEAETADGPAHGSTMFLAREVTNDDTFVETLGLTVQLVGELTAGKERSS